MSVFTKSFYINSPVSIQQLTVIGYGLMCRLVREGRLFRGILSELEKSQWYSETELKELQKERLRLIVMHAYENVPYYRRVFKKLGLRPSDIKEIQDLNKLPVISKKDVITNPEDFLAVNMNKHLLKVVFTSGTTGTPLKLYRDMYSINFENAILKRQYRWAGLGNMDKKVILRSSLTINSNTRRPPFWRYDYFQKALIASGYHLSKENIGFYASGISRYKPSALETVPSAGYLFAKLLDSEDLDLNFKYIFTSSERLSTYQRDFMEKKFNAMVFDHYGLAERNCSIGTCEKGSYHIYPEYGIIEFLPVSGNNGEMEIVGTGLNNFAMPLLRYRTGDIARPASRRCSCGRDFDAVDRIDGRILETSFITSDGRILPFITGTLSIDVKGVIETQFIQERIGSILVKVVANNMYSEAEESKIRKSIKNFIGSDADLIIEKVPFIPRDKSGKFRQFISNVQTRDMEPTRASAKGGSASGGKARGSCGRNTASHRGARYLSARHRGERPEHTRGLKAAVSPRFARDFVGRECIKKEGL